MELYIAADHNGFEMKRELTAWLRQQGHTVTDLGPNQFEKTDDYPDFAVRLAEMVAENTDDRRGILICGSGVGMAVAADKVPGIRAALIHDPAIATVAQRDDNINVLALGAAYIDIDTTKQVISNWLSTPFSGQERHRRRLGKITTYEQSH